MQYITEHQLHIFYALFFMTGAVCGAVSAVSLLLVAARAAAKKKAAAKPKEVEAIANQEMKEVVQEQERVSTNDMWEVQLAQVEARRQGHHVTNIN